MRVLPKCLGVAPCGRPREFLQHAGCIIDELLGKLLDEVVAAQGLEGFEGAHVER